LARSVTTFRSSSTRMTMLSARMSGFAVAMGRTLTR